MSDDARKEYRQRLDNHIVEERMAKIDALRETGTNPFANGFVVSHTAADIVSEWAGQTAEQLEAVDTIITVAGRLRFHRKMGKAAFLKIQDRTCIPGLKDADGGESQDNFLQAFVSKVNIGDENFDAVKALDLGDIIGIEGTPMRTRTGELTIQAKRVVLLTKSLRPLPEKFKGLSDVETRFRQRYVDLVMNEEAQQIFRARTRMVRQIRDFLDARGYMEVETPMMHVTPGGASARPFKTHHNALDIPLFLRIAPELYLKRLIVGGFERVYELNRNFRNEGVSRKHNPEFTMLEFYQAYATYEDLMDLTEEMVAHLAESLHGRDESGRITFECEGHTIDVTAPWARIPMGKSVCDALGVDEEKMWDRAYLVAEADKRGLEVPASWDEGKIVSELFEILVEPSLIQPTFITDFPASTSPLSRRKDADPRLVDRFELFVLGRELANAFSELNDPEDQYMRFAEQLQARADGDDEAMPMDEDYVRALEYGMPPTAGEGIGIDRLVMLLTGTDSIREVILFPHMRPE